jgi:AAA+ ATPase superfamily predicted ATPase
MKIIPNYTFFSDTAAIDQMKFSGSLRLVKNEEVLSGIFKYEGMNEFLSINRASIGTRNENMIENASTFLNMQGVRSTAGIQFLQDSQIKSPKRLANSQQNIFKFFNDAIIRKATLEIIWIPQMHE